MGEIGGVSSHEQLLAKLIEYIENEEVEWYENQSGIWLNWWIGLTVSILCLSIVSSILAAIIDKTDFEKWGRSVLITIPILTSGLTAFVQIFRVREKEALREFGRIEVDDILRSAKSYFISCKTEEEYRGAYHAVRSRFVALELAQHRGDVALRMEQEVKNRKRSAKPSGS